MLVRTIQVVRFLKRGEHLRFPNRVSRRSTLTFLVPLSLLLFLSSFRFEVSREQIFGLQAEGKRKKKEERKIEREKDRSKFNGIWNISSVSIRYRIEFCRAVLNWNSAGELVSIRIEVERDFPRSIRVLFIPRLD